MALSHDPHTVPVISNAAPTDDELRETEAMVEFMKQHNLYESESEMYNRVEVLHLLAAAVKTWVKAVARYKGMAPSEIEEANANVYTFGSFRLNTHGPGDDIDTHCVGPRWLDRRNHFFGHSDVSLQTLLQQEAWVESLQAVPDAYVPVLKLKIKGVEVDLTFAQLPRNDVPEQLDLQNNDLLRGMDETSVKSINGCRVTDKIMQINMNMNNLKSFQLALRFLKFWGKRRAIYSNVMGFLGGVNFAILVTRVCMNYPGAAASTIVRKFFKVFSLWDWKGHVPVMIAGMDYNGHVGHMVWDPQCAIGHGAREIFPIITPCYPASNSTFNVSECTKAIMLEELQRGRRVCDGCDLAAGKPLNFAELTRRNVVFGKGTFNKFLQVLVAASSQEDAAKWAGLVNAKVKRLSMRLHNLQGQLLARPWPKEINVPMEELEDGRPRTCWMIGLRRPKHGGQHKQSVSVDVSSAIQEFKMHCQSWAGFKAGMTIEIKLVQWTNLPEYVQALSEQPWDAEETAKNGAAQTVVPVDPVKQEPEPADDAAAVKPEAGTPDAANGALASPQVEQPSEQPGEPAVKEEGKEGADEDAAAGQANAEVDEGGADASAAADAPESHKRPAAQGLEDAHVAEEPAMKTMRLQDPRGGAGEESLEPLQQPAMQQPEAAPVQNRNSPRAAEDCKRERECLDDADMPQPKWVKADAEDTGQLDDCKRERECLDDADMPQPKRVKADAEDTGQLDDCKRERECLDDADMPQPKRVKADAEDTGQLDDGEAHVANHGNAEMDDVCPGVGNNAVCGDGTADWIGPDGSTGPGNAVQHSRHQHTAGV